MNIYIKKQGESRDNYPKEEYIEVEFVQVVVHCSLPTQVAGTGKE